MKETSIDSCSYECEAGQNELARLAFDLWSSEQAKEFETVPGLRVVNIYKVVRSVIENDLTEIEKTAAVCCLLDGRSAAAAAATAGTSRANIYKALTRAKDKIRLVLKHLIDCEEYKREL